nr:MAG TPA: hypothetical protein [Caudoviricetes sp.]
MIIAHSLSTIIIILQRYSSDYRKVLSLHSDPFDAIFTPLDQSGSKKDTKKTIIDNQ